MATCAYKPALLKDRVAIQSVTRVKDGQGGSTESWADGPTVWAQVTPLNGYERMRAMQLAAPVTHKLLIRYRAGLSTKNRLRLGTRTFDIKEVIDLENRHAWMQVICVEGEELQSMGTWDEINVPWGEATVPLGPGFARTPYDQQTSAWDDIDTNWDATQQGNP